MACHNGSILFFLFFIFTQFSLKKRLNSKISLTCSDSPIESEKNSAFLETKKFRPENISF